jgi:pyridoxine kinase
VIGDIDRGIFVRAGIPELIRDRAVPLAQIITPNAYELEVITGRRTSSLEDVLAGAEAAQALGPDVVLVTSVRPAGAAPGTIDMVLATADGGWSVTTPALPQTFNGAGDLTAALFLAQLLDSGDAPAALARTASSVFGALAATAAAGERELQLVSAQEEIVHPSRAFSPVRLR